MREYSSLLLFADGKIVLQLRDNKQGIRYPVVFSFFGGGAEPGETPKQTLMREIKEELSLDLEGKPVKFYKRFEWNGKLMEYLEEIRKKMPDFEKFFGYTQKVFLKEAENIIDNLFVLEISRKEAESLELREGKAKMSFSADKAKTLEMVPLDKVMLLYYLSLK